MQPTTVKALAEQLGLPVWTPERLNDPAATAELAALQADLFVVVAYGQILNEAVLALPRLGAINIHGSLLPAYRGAAPIHRAVMDGLTETGVSIMYLDKGMDSGDVIATRTAPIGENDTTGDLYSRLCSIGSSLLLEVLPQIEAGTAPRTPQQHERATYARMINKEDEVIDWQLSAKRIHDHIRALNPQPGAYTFFRGKRLKLWESRMDTLPGGSAAPGEVVQLSKEAIWVRCGEGVLQLITVQPEGKARMAGGDLARGYQIKPGEQLG